MKGKIVAEIVKLSTGIMRKSNRIRSVYLSETETRGSELPFPARASLPFTCGEIIRFREIEAAVGEMNQKKSKT